MTAWIPPGPAILFCPADRPERFSKAAAAADCVILDLEDGCRPENRAAARQHVIDSDLDSDRTIVRVNPADTEDFDLDVEALAASGYSLVMLAKTESTEQVTRLQGYLVIALVETPKGAVAAEPIAEAAPVVALLWGAEDLTAGLGGSSSRRADGTYRDVVKHVRSRVHLAAGAFGKTALDSVYLDIPDTAGLREEALDAAAGGYGATVCIHPSQVPVIREAYRPDDDQADWARRLLAEAENNRGAFRFDGRMVDEPLFRQAQAIERRTRAATPQGE
ncbi:HpcH/HpaI aldolase/citrate lyase family protein [Corynebacterium sputi]|uniref:HpcH/HpaI aldolase/citrate lyase family protein n=1 Tax=Corynebacterium sputi TaxID=489915 RepID=UPI000402DAA8|nr:CoA ester lyase [Corynebacterium sputi]